MTVCYFGTYNPKYPRNRVLIEGLKKNGVQVIECNSRRPWAVKYISLVFQFLLKARSVDAIVVGFPMGRGVVALLKLFRCFIPPLKIRGSNVRRDVTGGVMSGSDSITPFSAPYLKGEASIPIIIDGFVSQYDAEVLDRKHLAEDSKKAKKLFRWEQAAFRFASAILVDTQANAEYYSKLFSIPRDHFAVVPVGTDEGLFHPQVPPLKIVERSGEHSTGEGGVMNDSGSITPFSPPYLKGEIKANDFIIHFSGTYNQLQGVDVIIRAVHILKNEPIHVRLVGNGEEYEKIVQLAKELGVYDRIEFIPRVPYDEYARLTREADMCLGIFSNSPKTQRVIPNKVAEAMACGKAIITADTPAVRELLTNGVNVRLCQPSNPEDLAEKIMELYRDEQLRAKLGENARKVFLEELTAEKIGRRLLELLERVRVRSDNL